MTHSEYIAELERAVVALAAAYEAEIADIPEDLVEVIGKAQESRAE